MKRLLLLLILLSLPLTPQETKYSTTNPHIEITTNTTQITYMDALNKITQLSNQFHNSTHWMNKQIKETDSITKTNTLIDSLPNQIPYNLIAYQIFHHKINQLTILTTQPYPQLFFAAKITQNEWFTTTIYLELEK